MFRNCLAQGGQKLLPQRSHSVKKRSWASQTHIQHPSAACSLSTVPHMGSQAHGLDARSGQLGMPGCRIAASPQKLATTPELCAPELLFCALPAQQQCNWRSGACLQALVLTKQHRSRSAQQQGNFATLCASIAELQLKQRLSSGTPSGNILHQDPPESGEVVLVGVRLGPH